MITRLEVKAAIQVSRPPAEVYESIVDPVQMSQYFIATASGPMEEGREITWKFPEFAAEFPIRVARLDPGSFISFYWTIDGEELITEISLEPARQPGATVIRIAEKSREPDEAGLRWLKQNTEGWANFLACLKAWLEYGINLRIGAFDFMR